MRKFYLLACCVLYSAAVNYLCAQQFNVVGTAVQNSCACYTLTNANPQQAGAVWNNNPINLTHPFDFTFNVYLGAYNPDNQGGGCGQGADGICFVLQNTNTGYYSGGGGLGYEGFPNQSLAIELDTYQNGWDPAYSHLAIEYNGQVQHPTGTLAGPVQMSSSEFYTMDGNWHTLEVKWDSASQTINTYFDGVFRLNYTFPGGIISDIFLGNGSNIYWGFTGSTGALCNEQEFCINFTPLFADTITASTCGSDTVQFINNSTSGLNNINSYFWNFGDGDTSNLQNPNHVFPGPGIYNVSLTIIDQSLCSADTNITIIVPSGLVVTATHTDVSCFGSNNGTLTLNVSGGTGPYTYQGNNIDTGNTTFSNLPSGQCGGVITDAHGCSVTITDTINSPGPQSLALTNQNIACAGLSDGSANALFVNATGSVNYLWSNSQTGSIINNLNAGNYTVTATDSNNCTLTGTVVITTAPPLNLSVATTDAACAGGNGSATATLSNGGVPPFVFNWSSGGGTGPNAILPAGNYTVTITDSSGCTATAAFTINQGQSLTLTVSTVDALCNGANGQATVAALGGIAPYNYTWNFNSLSGSTVSLPAGNYVVTGTDANSCSQTATCTINQPPPISVQETQTNIQCFGGSNGSISLTAGGGTGPNYTFGWTPNVSNNNSANLLTSGTYTIVVTDANNCTISVDYIVTEGEPLAITSQVEDVLCFDQNNGAISVSASGGVPAYQYVAVGSNGQLSSSNGQFTNLAAGAYIIIITDQNLCTDTITAEVLNPAPLQDSLVPHNISCFNANDGTIAVITSGGTPDYTYAFSNGDNNNSGQFYHLPPGNYSVTISDANGCRDSLATVLTQPQQIFIGISPDSLVMNLGQSIQLQGSSNYDPAATYQWGPPFGLSCYNCPSPLIEVNTSQLYTVTVSVNINGNTCTVDTSIYVTVIPHYDIFIPNVFSPNSDGNNDYFQIYGQLNTMKYVEVEIFDRSGEKVFESTDINFKWDGTYKGKPLPPTVLVYTLHVVFIDNHSEKLFKGGLTLLR